MKGMLLLFVLLLPTSCLKRSSLVPINNNVTNDDKFRGASYFRQGDYKKSLAYFESCVKTDEDFAPYCLIRLADAHLELRNYAKSKEAAKAVFLHEESNTNKTLKKHAAWILGKTSRHKDEAKDTITYYEALLGLGFKENADILEALISAYRAENLQDKAAKYEKKLLINFPSTKMAKSLIKQNGLNAFNLSDKEFERRQNNLISALLFNQISDDQKERRKTTKISPEFRARMDRIAIKSLVYNDNIEKALRYALKRATKNEHPYAFENYAWVLGKAYRLEEASKAHWQFYENALDKDDKARGCFFQGYSLFELNRYKDAQEAWDRCSSCLSNTEYDELHDWYNGLAYLLRDEFKDAQRAFSDMAHRLKKSKEWEKYQFFNAYTLNKLGEKQKSIEGFKQIINGEKVSYYTLLARNYAQTKALKTTKIPSDALIKLASVVSNEDCLKAMKLADMDLNEEGKDLILNAKVTREEKLALLQKIDQFKAVYERSSALFVPKIKDDTLLIDSSIRASYPLPHKELAEKTASRFNIKMSLLYAIMRVESGFSHDALSPRGARGLMQIMPHVGENLANKLSFEDFEHDHLFHAKTSIELGGRLLSDLLSEFKQPYLAIAAYNAGEHNVRQWVKDFGFLPKELFVERLPFKETREYLKKVLPSMSLYDALGGEKLSLNL